MQCEICPRHCEVDGGKFGFCGDNSQISLSWAGLHFGEEPVLTVFGGSGAIFVSGCNLRCAFCQNFQISQKGFGKKVSPEEFAEICLSLQDAGAENINIVTGTHEAPALIEGMRLARSKGLALPFCWNSSGYESANSIRALSEFVSVWLPDLKTLNSLMAESLFRAKDYPKVAAKAAALMAEISPLRFVKKKDKKSGKTRKKIVSGVIVRHLFLPGRISDTRAVLEFFAENLADKALLSVMTQYTPVKFPPDEAKSRAAALSSFQNRLTSPEEADEILEILDELNLLDGYIQTPSDDENWLPNFERKSPFCDKSALTVWSCIP